MIQKPKVNIQALWDIEYDLMHAFGTIESVEERFNLMPGADLSRDSLHPKISCTLHKVRSQLKSSMNMLREHYPDLKIRAHKALQMHTDLDWKCKKCPEGIMEIQNYVCLMYPVLYVYKCNVCGDICRTHDTPESRGYDLVKNRREDESNES